MKKKYAVVTGASSGLGKEFAIRLAKEGFDLVLVARRENRLIELSEYISGNITGKNGAPLDIKVIVADLSRENECYRLINEISNLPVHIFINNAGFGDCGLFIETENQKDLDMIDVNIKALHLLSKLILRRFQKQRGGYLLNVASSAGLIPGGPYMATYYATKAYVVSLTRALAQEMKEIGNKVYVGALCPGPVDTEFNDVANVEFALKGISAKECVKEAIDGMKKKEVIIVPSLRMKLATSFGRFLPPSLYVYLAGQQQKKKLGKNHA